MPVGVTFQQTSDNGPSSYRVPSLSSIPSRNDDAGLENSTTRRTQAAATENLPHSDTSVNFPDPSGVSGLRRGPSNTRKLSIRSQKVPLGPRPQESRRRNPSSTILHSGNSSISSTNDSINSGSSRFSNRFNTMQKLDHNQHKHLSSEGGEFLAPISFDDFQDSITGESNLDDFPMPAVGHSGSGFRIADFQSDHAWANGNNENRPSQKLRSRSVRQAGDFPQSVGHSSATNTATSVPGAAPSTARFRRQSLAHPTTAPSGATQRAPRKSIGPGFLPISSASARRPSLTTPKSSADLDRFEQIHESSRPQTQHFDSAGRLESKSYGNLRNVKSKSFHPLTKEHQDSFLAAPRGTDCSRSPSTDSVRTPVRSVSGKAAATTPGKRTSVIQPHATGLGARTISPTDARRLKRMSMAGQLPQVSRPPTQTETVLPRPRSSAQSPSHVHRKSVTPSSTRATPDANRKSGKHSSLNPSHNSVRNSGHVLHPKFLDSYPPSRIPTPKPRVENTSAGSGEEEVPPVPAIPKAYESPHGGPEFPSSSYKVAMLSENSSLNPNRGSDSAADNALRAAAHDRTETPNRRAVRTPSSAANGKKNPQSLKIPPLSLHPHSTPMGTKVESFGDGERDTKDPKTYATPTSHPVAKTPSTPLTASKASFFIPHNEDDATPAVQPRSSTSHFFLNSTSTPSRVFSSSSRLGAFDTSNNRAISPYDLPSSLKGHSGEPNDHHQNLNGDASRRTPQSSKLTGPRPQTQASLFASNVEAHSGPSTPSETESNSVSGSSLLNQIALTRKRGSSRAQHTSQRDSERAKYNNIPSRLPSTGNRSGVSTTKPTSPDLKPTMLQPRHQSSYYNQTSPATKEPGYAAEQGPSLKRTSSNDAAERDRTPGRSSSSILSPVHKIISSAKINAGASPRSSDSSLDTDESAADEEMRKLNSKRRGLENSAKQLDELRRKAGPKERVGPAQALRIANLNIFERGEIIDFRDIYFCGTQNARKHVGDLNAQSANFGYDDDRGDYNIVIGDHLAYRYEVVDVLGKGSFGQVVRCIDHKTGGLVAVKIIRNKKRFHQQALVEVGLLKKLKEWDPHHFHSVVNFTQSFYFRGHLCISTELLGMNLYEFIKAHDFKGFSLNLIRRFTKQILSSLILLRSKRVIHCDLKPENILLVHPMSSEVRVIDFGSSCFENEKVYTYIQSRFYRSPEVILGMSYGMPIDMWSLGCILAELYTGYPIFPGQNEQEQLACIMEVFGPPEKHLIEKSTRRKLFFDSLGKPRITVSSKGRRRRPSSKDLKQVLRCEDEPFLNFVARCLRWDPARRLTPLDAMNHEFITGVKPPRPRPQTTLTPTKRSNITSAPTRPLPEPPGTGVKNGTLARTRDSSGNNTTRPTFFTKRHPTVSGLSPSMGSKRTSNTATAAGSALPRAANRSISGKPDLSTVGTTGSLVGSRR